MLAFAAIAGCGGLPRPTAGVTDAELQGIAASVAKATGYPLDSIELTGSLNRIRFTLSDATLANAGQPEREQKAGSVVAAAQIRMASCQPCSAIAAMSIAIIHSSPNGPSGAWHVEDVVEFRRGPDGTFQLHTI